MSSSNAGGRRKPAPPLPKPTVGTDNASTSNNNGNGASTTTGGGGSGAGLQPTAKAWVPGGGASTTTTASSSASTLTKTLSPSAAVFQPKFSGNSSSASASSSNNNNNNGNPEPTPESIKSATAKINTNHAKVIASKSKMSATATGFTPTRNDSGSFPSSPEKSTPASLNSNNNNSKNPPPQLPSSPPSGVKKATLGGNNSSSTTSADSPNTTTTTMSKQPSSPTIAYPDPFKNSKLDFSEDAKKKLESSGGFAHPAPERDPMGLNSSWTLHALDQSSRFAGAFGGAGADQVQQQQTITKLTQIADIESFWRLLRSVPPPASRSAKFTYYFFRKTIFPSWEEPRNKNGGTFQFSVCDGARGNSDKDLANDVWLLILLGLIGETFAESSCINGVSFKVRKSMSIEFWTANCNARQIGSFMTSVKDAIKQRFGEGNPFTKMRLLEGLEFTSNETNSYKANPPPPPPPPPAPGATPQKGKKNQQHRQQQQQQQQQEHQHHAAPSTANDFRL